MHTLKIITKFYIPLKSLYIVWFQNDPQNISQIKSINSLKINR